MSRASVTIGQLRDHLSAHLHRVRGGQELVVLDRRQPVARIVPFETKDDADAVTRELVARGVLRAPAVPMKWAAFDRLPCPKVRGNAALEALLANRQEDER